MKGEPHKTNPPYPPLSELLKKSQEALLNFTPPLRGSRRSRAVYAKADAVGGKTRFLAIPNYTPHRFTCGLAPLVHRLPLKGGVKFSTLLLWGFSTGPSRGGRGGWFYSRGVELPRGRVVRLCPPSLASLRRRREATGRFLPPRSKSTPTAAFFLTRVRPRISPQLRVAANPPACPEYTTGRAPRKGRVFCTGAPVPTGEGLLKKYSSPHPGQR